MFEEIVLITKVLVGSVVKGLIRASLTVIESLAATGIEPDKNEDRVIVLVTIEQTGDPSRD